MKYDCERAIASAKEILGIVQRRVREKPDIANVFCRSEICLPPVADDSAEVPYRAPERPWILYRIFPQSVIIQVAGGAGDVETPHEVRDQRRFRPLARRFPQQRVHCASLRLAYPDESRSIPLSAFASNQRNRTILTKACSGAPASPTVVRGNDMRPRPAARFKNNSNAMALAVQSARLLSNRTALSKICLPCGARIESALGIRQRCQAPLIFPDRLEKRDSKII